MVKEAGTPSLLGILAPTRRAHTLARFRADPRLVRVSVRCSHPDSIGGPGYFATVAGREPGSGTFEAWAPTVAQALDLALGIASERGLVGVDPFMEWAYEHPWGAAGVEARIDHEFGVDA